MNRSLSHGLYSRVSNYDWDLVVKRYVAENLRWRVTS